MPTKLEEEFIEIIVMIQKLLCSPQMAHYVSLLATVRLIMLWPGCCSPLRLVEAGVEKEESEHVLFTHYPVRDVG